jgi:molybdenum cofactor synthesis domain-containing protein
LGEALTPTAGIIVIGNEVLSGKVEEQNARYLIRELRALGVQLERVVIVRDEIDAIAEEVARMAPRHRWIFTTGGVGATHDDVTMEGVARGLAVPLERNADIERLVRGHFKERVTDTVLRMADLPKGAELVGLGELLHPVVRVQNFFILPGVPEFVQAKFPKLRSLLQDRPFVLRQIFVSVGEDRIADLLKDALVAVPGIEIGSYPRFDRSADHRVKITIEARDEALVQRGVEYLLGRLEAAIVVRVE